MQDIGVQWEKADQVGHVWLTFLGGCLRLPDYLRSKPFPLDLCILADVLALIKARGATNLVDALFLGADWSCIG
jgi:hypothetical protein